MKHKKIIYILIFNFVLLSSCISPIFQTKLNMEKIEIQQILMNRNVNKLKIPRLTEIYYTVPSDIRSIIMDIHYIESRYDSLAISNTGDYGLGQINYNVWREPIDSLLCAEYNTRSTVDKYLKAYRAGNNNKYVALYIYNGSIKYLEKYEKLWNEDIDLDEIKRLRFRKTI